MAGVHLYLTDPVLDLAALVGVLTGFYGGILRPARERRRVKSTRDRDEETFLHGRMGSMFDAPIAPAANRLEIVEEKVTQLDAKFDARIGVLTQSLDSVVGVVNVISEKISTLLPNGGNTNNSGDLIQRLAKERGVWLETEAERNRRYTDQAERGAGDAPLP